MYRNPPSSPPAPPPPPPPDRLPPPSPGGDSSGDEGNDAWIETLLRQNRNDDAYIDDDGFTARVVHALPRRARRRRWIVAGAILLGVALAFLFTWTTPLAWAPSATAGHLPSLFNQQPLLASYAVVAASLLVAASITWKTVFRQR